MTEKTVYKLRQVRLDRNLTQDKLADMADVNSASVSAVERGVQRPWPGFCEKVAAALELPIDELFSPEEYTRIYVKREAK